MQEGHEKMENSKFKKDLEAARDRLKGKKWTRRIAGADGQLRVSDIIADKNKKVS